jgi:hypothetical protein
MISSSNNGNFKVVHIIFVPNIYVSNHGLSFIPPNWNADGCEWVSYVVKHTIQCKPK